MPSADTVQTTTQSHHPVSYMSTRTMITTDTTQPQKHRSICQILLWVLWTVTSSQSRVKIPQVVKSRRSYHQLRIIPSKLPLHKMQQNGTRSLPPKRAVLHLPCQPVLSVQQRVEPINTQAAVAPGAQQHGIVGQEPYSAGGSAVPHSATSQHAPQYSTTESYNAGQPAPLNTGVVPHSAGGANPNVKY